MRIAPHTAYSWRADPRVPRFDDARVLVLMDGECALCSATARRIARLDRDDRVRIAPVQSPLGQGLLAHFGFDPDDPDTWLLLDAGRAYGGLDATLHLFPRLHWGFAPLRLLWGLPVRLRDWLYARVARNRYHVFGKADLCARPEPELRRRLVG